MSLKDLERTKTWKNDAIREVDAKAAKALALKKGVATGDSAVTDIPVAGILTTDTLRSVLVQDSTTGVFSSNELADASITSDGNIQLATFDSTGKTLLVEWN